MVAQRTYERVAATAATISKLPTRRGAFTWYQEYRLKIHRARLDSIARRNGSTLRACTTISLYVAYNSNV